MENEKIKELAEFLGCDEEDITVSNWNNRIFEIGNREYLVLTDEEAEEETTGRIEEDIWAFNAEFILNACGIDYNRDVLVSLQEMQNRCCESCNPFLLALVENTCGLDDFVYKAICCDGRGHFLASYDGTEYETDSYFVYRVN